MSNKDLMRQVFQNMAFPVYDGSQINPSEKLESVELKHKRVTVIITGSDISLDSTLRNLKVLKDQGFYITTVLSKAAEFLVGSERLEREILEIIFAAPETVQRISEEIAADEFTVPSFVRARSRCGGPVTLIVDDSGSVGSYVSSVVEPGVLAFIESFRGTPTQLQIVPFSYYADSIGPDWHNYVDMTDDAAVGALKGAVVSTLDSSGGTNWEDAFFRTLKNEDGSTADIIPNRVVFFTDGIATLEDSIEIVEVADLGVDVVDYTSQSDADGLAVYLQTYNPNDDSDLTYELFVFSPTEYLFDQASN